jgi:hypothetical protein
LFGPSEGGERTSARHERVDDVERLLPDGGLAALGLSPGAPPELAIPAEHRLTDARAAIAQFAAHVSALEQERETASDPERRAQLDETLTVIQQRLQIAQIAERAIAAELASADRGANDQAQDVTSSRAATASAPRAD